MAVNTLSSLPFLEITSQPVEKWGHTQSKMYKLNYTWTINNFSFLEQSTRHESPMFSGGPNDEIKWSLFLIPNPGTEYMTILLKLMSEPDSKSKVQGKFKISIINDQCQKTNEYKPSDLREFQLSESEKFINVIKRKTLLDGASVLLPEDTLTILCEIDFVTDKLNFSGRKSNQAFQVPECKLSDEFGKLFNSLKFSDVTLMVGTNECPAHKAILSARSDVFAAMFEHEMKESKLNIVTITDIDYEVFLEMLRYIYTGEAPKLKEMAAHLLAAADKYALKKLKVMSEEALFAELSIETAAETLVFADHYNADQLREKTTHFFKMHAKEIINTNGWQSIKHKSPLVSTILEALFKPTK